MRERLVVIVPCYNEESSVEETVRDILAEESSIDMDLAILLVDDGSRDSTRAKMEAIAKAEPRCNVLVNEPNRGIGYSFLRGVNWAQDEDWVTIQPGDNEIIFSSLHSLLDARDQYDLILGYHQNPIIRTVPRRVASALFTHVANFAYGFSFKYLNGAYLFRARVFKGIEMSSEGYSWAPELVAKALLRDPVLKVGERPFASRGRKLGETKAFRPAAVAKAAVDFLVGYRSAAQYRDAIVRQPARRGPKPKRPPGSSGPAS